MIKRNKVVESIEGHVGSLEEFLRTSREVNKHSFARIARELEASVGEVLDWCIEIGITFKRSEGGEIERLLLSYIGKTTQENEEPEQETYMTGRLSRDFFARDPRTVARELLGRTINVRVDDEEIISGRLKQVAAYQGATKTTSEGVKYEAGRVSISTKFGQQLIDIATGQADQSSCITIRAADIDLEGHIEQIQGPGNVSKALGITKETQWWLEGVSIYGRKMWIDGESADQKQVTIKSGTSKNCQGIYAIS